jgi:hypothetical protein
VSNEEQRRPANLADFSATMGRVFYGDKYVKMQERSERAFRRAERRATWADWSGRMVDLGKALVVLGAGFAVLAAGATAITLFVQWASR